MPGSLVPLRQKVDKGVTNQENGFADRLDKAIAGGESHNSSAGNKARDIAESLTLQMLQSSLVLSGDSQSGLSAPSGTPAISSAQAFLQAYNANLANGLGNLVSRVMKMAVSYEVNLDNLDNPIPQLEIVVARHVAYFELNKAMDAIWAEITALDAFIQKEAARKPGPPRPGFFCLRPSER